ncbi:zinc-dependent alcohol dehydrogenase family protein [Inhella proteolytica]|uniref:NAD(P)-dependent alcohol dehydrogenase n=1 Tax=Inhella proteolytica TaxID=2795029 RepID=A0A931J3D5_9BURK|nr:NAD(P)-dependent alcohol dehydrogenase [Inhella proteolytica]MBH9576809.1 NAD(P)-dependent alcohol dehydrogenase [Inhella proteolytica]
MTPHFPLTVNAWELPRGLGLAGLRQVAREVHAPGRGEVLLRPRVAALNARDAWMADAPGEGAAQPGSDGAGEVLAVGEGVSTLRPGDRVLASFFPHWQDGPPNPTATRLALGGRGPGLLAQAVLLPAEGLLHLPEDMDFETAASLPTAGVTAWHALFEVGPWRPGEAVLILGTGGVATWALQLAVAAGLRAIVSSSRPERLAQAQALGAAATLRIGRDEAGWAAKVRELNGGQGVDRVIETSGQATLAESMRATRPAGTVAVVGGTSGWGGAVDADALIDGALRLQGVLVGSRRMLADLLRFVQQRGLRPTIAARYGFAELPQAFATLAAGERLGKVLVTLD